MIFGVVLLLCAGLVGGRASAQQNEVRKASAAGEARVAARLQHERLGLRRAISYHRRVTWKWEAAAYRPRTATNYSEGRVKGLGYLRWANHLWTRRMTAAKRFARSHPWARMVHRTTAYRGCLASHESSHSGGYKAENGGTRYVESARNSDASGKYQFLDSTWMSRFEAAKEYFRGRLKGHWTHAADAPPDVQDAVAAYAIVADKGVDWTWSDCKAIGVSAA
jgi:hypothetical protein